MEREFHASPEAKDRAIFGFAMGGYQAVTIGLNHPGTFGYVAGASANFRPAMDLAANFQGLHAGLETAKRETPIRHPDDGHEGSGRDPAEPESRPVPHEPRPAERVDDARRRHPHLAHLARLLP